MHFIIFTFYFFIFTYFKSICSKFHKSISTCAWMMSVISPSLSVKSKKSFAQFVYMLVPSKMAAGGVSVT